MDMDCPPTKRFRVQEQDFLDPFGDEDFTQDDLEEIDVLSSQALGYLRTSSGPPCPRPGLAAPAWTQNRAFPLGRAVTNQSSENPTWKVAGESGGATDRQDHSRLDDAELKCKLKQVEQELLMKEGEVRVLRDSLKSVQQEKEVQKQAQHLLHQEREKEQRERERELGKKIQSLQAEMHFKDAEINEMKTKLSERSKAASPMAKHSPKVPTSINHMHNGSSSSTSSPTGSGFITKEIFGAHLPCRVKKSPKPATPIDGDQASCRDPFLLRARTHNPHLQNQGLLGVLLQSSGSLGLCHLLRSKDPATIADQETRTVQNLALTGLTMLSQNQAGPANTRRHPGTVLLLPLVDLYLSQLYQFLSSTNPTGTAPSAPSACGTGPARLADNLAMLEENGLAALRVLLLLLAHSDEVVEAVLSERHAHLDQNAVLRIVLGLCRGQNPALVRSGLKTLSVLMERTPRTHSHRWQDVRWSQAVCACVSPDRSVQTVRSCVCVLRSVCDLDKAAVQLCSQHEVCVFLKLFRYIRTRPDPHATHTHWTLLDYQLVCLLTRLLTQKEETWTAYSEANCPCYTELIQVVVVILHRQWLELRETNLTHSTGGVSVCHRGVSVLRGGFLLLHWLQQQVCFPEAVTAVIHMYDLLLAHAKDMLTHMLLEEGEELALEEMSRPEAEDMDIEPCS